ncbi:LOW QUALITY PROTEIN: hypothetical protein MAR_027826 [Mya arenaria]|uniref:DNA-directed DNA polymerase n=1 Tax=Mya arenaria TaxID=6604 RepID=A0ABY7F2T2_MYAAR|nr:LOW QUALITY PROTEIN: hypothetical protein MAR_027826 [Mya arenaria]
MLFIKNRGFKRRYFIGGSGILDSVASMLSRVFTSTAAKAIGDVSLGIARKGSQKALQIGQKAAIDAGTKLVERGVTKMLAPKQNHRERANSSLIKMIRRGAAHNDCNLKYRTPKFTPVVSQPEANPRYVIDHYTDKNGEEKEVKHELRFIDSFKFMASSLDKLVGNLQKDQFVNLECGASGINGKYKGKQLSLARKALLKRKGVYPYDYVDVTSKNEFYSKLTGDDISDEDHVHAQQVWKEFECKTMRDYHNLYLTSDVLLLADVLETFRDVCLTNYNLDPAWYYTAPGLAWDAALKLTKVKSDQDMLLMIEKGIRGGVSTIMTRYGKANNKYMGDEFDPKKDTNTLMYDFHYNYIKPNYILDACGSSVAKLLFTDTDSLAYEIKTEDFYADINENVEQMFDTSNFPPDHPSGIKSGVNKKAVGMFKDECGGKIMHEFVELRAKLYS